MTTLTFGVPQLDRELGDVPLGARILLRHDPGVDAVPFLYQAAGSHDALGTHVVYLTSTRTPDQVRRGIHALGLPHGHVRFVDAYSALNGIRSDEAYWVADPDDPVAVADALTRAAKEHPDSILLVDALSQMLDRQSAKGPVSPRRLAPVLEAMGQFRFAICLFTAWPYGNGADALLSWFEGSVSLKGVEGRVVTKNFFTVEQLDWAEPHAVPPRMYRVLEPGGVVVYLPKIVVTGPANAGKSTFIRSAADRSVSADRHGTTVALDRGQITLDGLQAELFGTPGQSRFDPLLKTIGSHAVGVVLLVDGRRPETFPQARQMLEAVWNRGASAVIAVNKQDLPDAMTPEEAAKVLQGPPGTPVVGCQATRKEDARQVLTLLFQRILQGDIA